MVEASIFDMKSAAADAFSKLAIDASASFLERQCTITSHSPPSPATLSRDTKPGCLDTCCFSTSLSTARNSAAVAPGFSLKVTT